MVFNSYIFIFCMLPLSIVGYFGLNRLSTNAGKLFLIAWSFVCLGFYNILYSLFIAGSIVFNYLMSKLVVVTKGSIKRVITFIAISINIFAIFYFKYINFSISNINHFFDMSITAVDIIVPLGISFYTIQQISYIIDAYRGEIADVCAVDYFLYVSFFPQLVQGPIILHHEIIPQFNDWRRKTLDYENIAIGIIMFVGGLFKKVIIADSLGKIVNWGMGDYYLQLTSLEIVIVMLSYSFQLYFDFSGYCDMAMGIGRMMNFQFPINFNSPYRAITISDFWDRWHITLTRFLTKYIYFPLGGSRKGKVRTLINTMIVFLISGIWHGANWTFILWGCLHGVGKIIERILDQKPIRLWAKCLRWFISFSFVNVLWLLFRSTTVQQWLSLMKGVFVNGSFELSRAFYTVKEGILADLFGPSVGGVRKIWIIITSCLVIYIIFISQNNMGHKLEKKLDINTINLIISIVTFIICFMSLGGETSFLYFNF